MTQLALNDFNTENGYITNDEVVNMINTLNRRLRTNLFIYEGRGNTRGNRSVLRDYLNESDYINNEGRTAPRIEMRKINQYINRKLREQQEQLEQDNNYFANFNKEQFKEGDKLDKLNEQINTKQNKAKEIANKIQIAKNALNEAIDLINQKDHPILDKKHKKIIIPDSPLNQDIKKEEYYEPENEELYEYLEKHIHNFDSKSEEYLIINYPFDLDRAIATLKTYDYKNDFVKERIDNKEPIITYYFNNIKSLNNIYESLYKVYKEEFKPFKIHFQLSGIFETSTFNFETYKETYEYEARYIRWKNYKSSIPILVNNEQSLEECKMYIETVLNSYETTTSNFQITKESYNS
ncbi:hypothetical protein M9Y10_009399 [Tritrichomonas musculus]|uniref:Uncharacterized protein n=1 Tax=Tritrichomonas musculus TaxID=1915356 RepID=A0ABR2IK71_9EUKA